jgi:hypothetical protein
MSCILRVRNGRQSPVPPARCQAAAAGLEAEALRREPEVVSGVLGRRRIDVDFPAISQRFPSDFP